jgi:histidinol-phosphate phosphatase family protein
MAVEKEVRLVAGYPCAGKTTFTQEYLDKGYTRINRDTLGGALDGLVLQKLGAILQDTDSIVPGVVMDNTYVNAAARAQTIAMCKRFGVAINCTLVNTSIEDAQVNFCMRMMQKHGFILNPEQISKSKDPGMLPPAALFGYRKNFEKPSVAEGFDQVDIVKFIRKPQGPSYKNKALLLDYDGSLRKTKSGEKYPTTPDDVEILPGRKEVLHAFDKAGWKLFGVSNQSGVSKGKLTYDMARKCFDKTNELLDITIYVSFCPHSVPPIACWCRKPQVGLLIYWIEKDKLDRTNTVMVGDMKTDQTCAERADVKFCNSDLFFGGKWKEYLR